MNWKIFLFFHFAFVLSAQSDSWTSKFLSSAFYDQRVKQGELLIDAASNTKFHLPLIRSISARIGITGAAFLGDTIYGYLRNEDNYALFIEPNSWLEIRRQKQLKQAKIKLYQSEHEINISQAITERYEVLLNFGLSQLWKNHYVGVDSLLQLKNNFLRKAIELNQKIELSDLLRTDKDLYNTIKEKNNYNELLNQLREKILSLSVSQPLDSDKYYNLILVEEIQLWFTSLHQNNFLIYDPELKLIEDRVEYLGAKLNYVNSQNRRILNDLRLSYDDPLYLTRPNRFNTFNNFSFRIGLNVPLVANNRMRKAEARLDLMEESISLNNQKIKAQEEVSKSRQELISAFSEYEQFMTLTNSGLIQKILKDKQATKYFDPHEWIEILLREKEYEEARLKLYEKVLRKYINFLKSSGGLVAKPYKNYLLSAHPIWGQ